MNNAGFGTYGDFAALDRDGEAREIAVNVTAVVRLTHAALDGMLARGHGAVMNISSVAGLQATPGNATYGATKAFVASFGEAVAGELAGTGVTLTTVLPGLHPHRVRRAGRHRRPADPRSRPGSRPRTSPPRPSPPPAPVARGWCPGALNKAMVAVANPIPRRLKRRVAARVAKRM